MSGSEGRGTSALAGAEEGGGAGRDGGTAPEVGLCASMEWVGLPDIAGELI